MTIQRQYFLPNCTLTLEGLSSATFSQDEFRPSLDMLMRFECHFSALNQAISGGSELLESLIAATNQCTQSWISGIQHSRSQTQRQSNNAVHLRPNTAGGFQLSIPASLLSGSDDAPTPAEQTAMELHLTPVQLFDLAEAFDQLLSDSQTLPNLTAPIQPLSRAEALSDQPLSQKAAPLILGTAGFALSALALFFVPAPEVQRPEIEPSAPTTESSPTPTSSPASGSDGGDADAQSSPTPESQEQTPTEADPPEEAPSPSP